jgi:hypothetical protein
MYEYKILENVHLVDTSFLSSEDLVMNNVGDLRHKHLMMLGLVRSQINLDVESPC